MSLLNKISKLVSNSHQNLVKLFYYDPRIPELALVGAQMKLPEIQRDEIDLLDQSILWNTPKKRKTTEKRMKARYGMKEWGTWKPYVKNKKIRVDYITGEYFESGRLAPETYKKVMAETMEIQKKMKEAFSPFLPKDKELTVLYENETHEDSIKDDKMRIIEMEKPRPQVFSSNLLQKTIVSQDKSSSTTVKPSGLG